MTEVSLESSGADVARGTPLRVLAETAYPLIAASARVRVVNFIPALARNGVSLAYLSALTDGEYEVLSSRGRIGPKAATLARSTLRALARPRPSHEVSLVHRLRLLHPLPGFDPPRILDVYDIDDALFVPFDGGVNQRFRWAKQEARRCIECLRRARLVVAGNPYLAARAQEYAARVEVVPSCVEPGSQVMHAHHAETSVTVGWIGSSTTAPYLRLVLPAFARLNAAAPRVKLILIGADRSIAAPWIEHRPWSLETESEDLASFDIGIAPQWQDEWAQGKCGYKLLQYFAAGIPAIGSPVGVARDLIGTERGLTADCEDDWHKALMALIEDPARRAEQGRAARSFVERHYSYERWAPELASLLTTVAG